MESIAVPYPKEYKSIYCWKTIKLLVTGWVQRNALLSIPVPIQLLFATYIRMFYCENAHDPHHIYNHNIGHNKKYENYKDEIAIDDFLAKPVDQTRYALAMVEFENINLYIFAKYCRAILPVEKHHIGIELQWERDIDEEPSHFEHAQDLVFAFQFEMGDETNLMVDPVWVEDEVRFDGVIVDYQYNCYPLKRRGNFIKNWTELEAILKKWRMYLETNQISVKGALNIKKKTPKDSLRMKLHQIYKVSYDNIQKIQKIFPTEKALCNAWATVKNDEERANLLTKICGIEYKISSHLYWDFVHDMPVYLLVNGDDDGESPRPARTLRINPDNIHVQYS